MSYNGTERRPIQWLTHPSIDLNQSSLSIEWDFGILIDDLSAYISYVSNCSPLTRSHRRRNARFGSPEVHLQPNGVVLILSNARNPFRHTLAAFAAAIAARNSVVLAAYGSHHFFSILQREAPKYLDSFTLNIVSVSKLGPLTEKVDQVVTIGKCPTPASNRVQTSIQEPHHQDRFLLSSHQT